MTTHGEKVIIADNKMNFKIYFPASYLVKDIYNDNIDINVILEDGQVFFATFFTLQNIQWLIAKALSGKQVKPDS
jgi:hypothetical protein